MRASVCSRSSTISASSGEERAGRARTITMTLAQTPRDDRLHPLLKVTPNRLHSRLPSEARRAEGALSAMLERGEEEGAPGERALGRRASASAVSLLPAAVATTVPIQMDRTCVRRARRLHLRRAERHHARGPDPHSEEGDLRSRSVWCSVRQHGRGRTYLLSSLGLLITRSFWFSFLSLSSVC
jgi:hypothetical protein